MSKAKQYLCSHLVTMIWNDQRASANMEKIWARGATLNAEEAIAAGTYLRMESPEFAMDVHVTGCVGEPDGFFVDVEFEPGYEWTPEQFEPMHLTDPDILLVRKLLSKLSPS
jgi:hypothetical protein